MARYGDPDAVERVESGGGPLVAVPETVLPFWTGADSEELDTDYDPRLRGRRPGRAAPGR